MSANAFKPDVNLARTVATIKLNSMELEAY
jgi:hypothetical protein